MVFSCPAERALRHTGGTKKKHVTPHGFQKKSKDRSRQIDPGLDQQNCLVNVSCVTCVTHDIQSSINFTTLSGQSALSSMQRFAAFPMELKNGLSSVFTDWQLQCFERTSDASLPDLMCLRLMHPWAVWLLTQWKDRILCLFRSLECGHEALSVMDSSSPNTQSPFVWLAFMNRVWRAH